LFFGIAEVEVQYRCYIWFYFKVVKFSW